MATNKTIVTDQSVTDFINTVENERKKADSYKLIEILSEVSGNEPKMWGTSIVGFGSYHYKYASGHEGDWALVGFSPRKSAISLYIYTECAGSEALLAKLGKFKMGKACIYVKRLADVDEEIIKQIAQKTIEHQSKTHTVNP